MDTIKFYSTGPQEWIYYKLTLVKKLQHMPKDWQWQRRRQANVLRRVSQSISPSVVSSNLTVHYDNTYNDVPYKDFTYNDFTYNDFVYNDFTYNDFTYKLCVLSNYSTCKFLIYCRK
jgi:hypothetical protein